MFFPYQIVRLRPCAEFSQKSYWELPSVTSCKEPFTWQKVKKFPKAMWLVNGSPRIQAQVYFQNSLTPYNVDLMFVHPLEDV